MLGKRAREETRLDTDVGCEAEVRLWEVVRTRWTDLSKLVVLWRIATRSGAAHTTEGVLRCFRVVTIAHAPLHGSSYVDRAHLLWHRSSRKSFVFQLFASPVLNAGSQRKRTLVVFAGLPNAQRNIQVQYDCLDHVKECVLEHEDREVKLSQSPAGQSSLSSIEFLCSSIRSV